MEPIFRHYMYVVVVELVSLQSTEPRFVHGTRGRLQISG